MTQPRRPRAKGAKGAAPSASASPRSWEDCYLFKPLWVRPGMPVTITLYDLALVPGVNRISLELHVEPQPR